MKARHGRYADTPENRRLHRVGQEYGHAAKEDPEAAKKSGKGEEAKEEKRTFDTARKELSSVLSHKDEFIQKYGEDEYNKRVGALVAEAKTLRDTEHTAEADKDFDKLKQPEKPKDTRSKKEKRTERLEKYKEQLKKVQEKMNQEGESEESRKMGEALEAKWKAKIEKLEAKVNRGKKKETPSDALANDIKEYTTKTSWLPREGTAIHFSDVVNSKGEKGELRIDLSGDSFEDGYDIKFGENFTAHAKDQKEAYAILEEFKAKDMPDVEVVDKKAKEPEEKKPWDNKGVGMPKSDGKKLFEGLTKEQQKALTDKYKDESESMLRQENMTPELVIGAIEEFIGENLYESDDVMDLAEELKVSKNEAQAIIRHTLDLEMKRLKGLEKEGSGSLEKGLVHVVGESAPRFSSKKGLVFADINDNVKKDFNRFSGTSTEDAVAFMNKVIDKTGFNGRAKLFYSGNSGWTLFDENEEKIGNLMYDGNKYGLEDATWGDGWVWRGWGSDWSRKLSEVVPKLNVRPEKPRM